MGETLTASDLNNQVVILAQMLMKVKRKLIQKLKKRVEILKRKKGSEEQKLLNERKIERLNAEVRAIKGLNKYEVAKFSLINTKTLMELNIQGNTQADFRALYKLATLPTVVRAVGEFRKNYQNWNQEVPFLLQRLGLQYRNKSKSSRKEEHVPNVPINQRTTNSKLCQRKEEQKSNSRKKVKQEMRSERLQRRRQHADAVSESDPEEMGQSSEIREIDLDSLLSEGKNEIIVLDNINKTAASKVEDKMSRKPPSSFFVGGSDSDTDHTEASIPKRERFEEKVFQKTVSKSAKTSKDHCKLLNRREKRKKLRKQDRSTKDEGEESETKVALHPSWAAKRKLKQCQKMQGSKGKKVKFSDEDD